MQCDWHQAGHYLAARARAPQAALRCHRHLRGWGHCQRHAHRGAFVCMCCLRAGVCLSYVICPISFKITPVHCFSLALFMEPALKQWTLNAQCNARSQDQTTNLTLFMDPFSIYLGASVFGVQNLQSSRHFLFFLTLLVVFLQSFPSFLSFCRAPFGVLSLCARVSPFSKSLFQRIDSAKL
jgi:hypothetical protein